MVTQANQPTAELYQVTVDNQPPYSLYGCQQDNSAVAFRAALPGALTARIGTSRRVVKRRRSRSIRATRISPTAAARRLIGRFDRELEHTQEMTAWPEMRWGAGEGPQVPIPVELADPHLAAQPVVLYRCANFVLQSTDEGRTWSEISPDLTRDDPSTQGSAGGPSPTTTPGSKSTVPSLRSRNPRKPACCGRQRRRTGPRL